MSVVVTKNKRERQFANQTPARHSGEGRNPPASSFRTPRSGDPESSSLPSAVEHGVDAAQVQAKMAWPMVRLGDVAKTSSGGTPKRSVSSYYDGDIPWVKSGELGDRIVYETEERISQAALEQSSAKLFPKGTLCVALYGATVGKLGILGIDAATNQAVCGIFLPESIDTRFAYRFLESKRRELIEKGKGGAQPNISQEIIRDLAFPLPAIGVQRQIIAEIEKQFTRLDAGLAALRRVQANLKRYRAAVLQHAYDSFGKNWLVRALSEVTSIVTKGSSPKWQGFDYCDDGIVFVRSQNVGWGKLDLTDVARLPKGFNEKEKKSVLKTGDVLLNIVGASIGRVAIATTEVDGGNVNQAVAVLRCEQEKMLPKFLMGYLLSPSMQTLIHAQAVDVARANFSLGDISRLPVPTPPLAEQTRIVAEVERRLSVIEELGSAVAANLQRATRLRQSILRRSFDG
jgi:restriction endonuclease S subunit